MTARSKTLLKWLGSLVLILAAVYVVLTLITGWQLRQAYAAVTAAGRPATTAQIIPPKVPDTDNAALLYQSAALILKADKAGDKDSLHQLSDLAAAVLAPEADPKAAAELWMALQQPAAVTALAQLQEGAAKPACRYELDYSKGAALLVPHLNDLRCCSRILAAAAVLQANHDNAAGAWENVAASLRLANALQTEPLLISQLVRIAQAGSALQALERVARQAPPSPAQAAQLDELLARLDDVKPLALAMDGERLLLGEWCYNLPLSEQRTLLNIGDNGGTPALAALVFWRLLAPLVQADHAAYIGLMLEQTRRCEQPVYAPQGKPLETLFQEIPRYCVMTRLLTPALGSCAKRFAEMQARVRLARLGLAIQEYRGARGVWPASLAELSSPSAPEAAIDPFTGQPLHYRQQDGGVLLYSVGPDGQDDGGKPQRPRKAAGKPEPSDLVFTLLPPAP